MGPPGRKGTLGEKPQSLVDRTQPDHAAVVFEDVPGQIVPAPFARPRFFEHAVGPVLTELFLKYQKPEVIQQLAGAAFPAGRKWQDVHLDVRGDGGHVAGEAVPPGDLEILRARGLPPRP